MWGLSTGRRLLVSEFQLTAPLLTGGGGWGREEGGSLRNPQRSNPLHSLKSINYNIYSVIKSFVHGLLVKRIDQSGIGDCVHWQIVWPDLAYRMSKLSGGEKRRMLG